jgi:hypothetical protein
MRGLKRLRSARVISTGHAFVQNLRRGHYELGWDINRRHQLPTIFTETRSRHLIEAPHRKSRLLPAYATDPVSLACTASPATTHVGLEEQPSSTGIIAAMPRAAIVTPKHR